MFPKSRARTAEAKDVRRRELLDAALDCFSETGFAATRMEAIAKRAKVSKGSLYLYFPSKEALFEALILAFAVPKLERLEAVAAARPPPAAALGLMMEVAGAAIEESKLPVLIKLVISEGSQFPSIMKFYQENVVARGLAAISRLLGAESGAETVGPHRAHAHDAARLAMAPVLMTALWRLLLEPVGAPPIDVKRLLRLHAGALARGLGLCPDPEKPS